MIRRCKWYPVALESAKEAPSSECWRWKAVEGLAQWQAGCPGEYVSASNPFQTSQCHRDALRARNFQEAISICLFVMAFFFFFGLSSRVFRLLRGTTSIPRKVGPLPDCQHMSLPLGFTGPSRPVAAPIAHCQVDPLALTSGSPRLWGTPASVGRPRVPILTFATVV